MENNLHKKSLDGLRGLACLIILLHHYVLGFYPALYSGIQEISKFKGAWDVRLAQSPWSLFWNGNSAVCMFFVLSGTVISYGYFIRREDQYIYESALKRYLHLMLPALLSCMVAYCILKCHLFFSQNAVPYTQSTTWLAGFYNFVPDFFKALWEGCIGIFIAGKSVYNPVLWTIYLEFVGSFIIYGVLIFFSKCRYRFFIYGIIMLWFFSQSQYYTAFLLGIIISDFYVNEWGKITKKLGGGIGCLCFILGVLLYSYPSVSGKSFAIHRMLTFGITKNLSIIYHIVGSALIILGVLTCNKIGAFFSNRMLVAIGKISFSIYLYHCIVLNSFSCWLFCKLIVLFKYHIAFAIMFIFSCVLIFLIASFMQKYIHTAMTRVSVKLTQHFWGSKNKL